MTLGTFLKDLFAVTRILKEKFHQEKIYLLGHSWGSQLGLYAAKYRPEEFHKFFGVGLVVNPIQNEIVMYDWTLARSASGKEGGRDRTTYTNRTARRRTG